MWLATIIDATDGVMARAVRVKEVLPGFDGRKLDDLIDFLNYTFLPLLLVWRARLLPEGYEACLLLPLVASAYGFCQKHAKTDDGFFLGFPSHWNLVAFYLYALQPLPGTFSLWVILVLAVLTFVPSVYLYPTQRGRLNMATSAVGGLWAILLCVILWTLPDEPATDTLSRQLAIASLFFPIWYMAASWVITLLRWRRHRKMPLAAHVVRDSHP
jgi:phosphatidylcholine synthase